MSIRANFTAYGTYVTDSLYQWDINRTLIVNGLNLDQAPEIHFYNSNMEKAIVRQATLDNGVATVTIPNALLQEALTIKADVCIYEDDVRKTIENIEIPVKAKARPLDYVFEDDGGEIYSYNELKQKLNIAFTALSDAKAIYNELKDEYGRIIAELPGVPDRMTELENTMPRLKVSTYTGSGNVGDQDSTKFKTLEFEFEPKCIILYIPGATYLNTLIALKTDNDNIYSTSVFANYGSSTSSFETYRFKFKDNTFSVNGFDNSNIVYGYMAIG